MKLGKFFEHSGVFNEFIKEKFRLIKKKKMIGRSSSQNFSNTEYQYNKASICQQIVILIWKNFKVLFNKATLVIGHILTVALVCLFILLLNYLIVNSVTNADVSLPDITSLDYLQRCDENLYPGCVSLSYGVIGNSNSTWSDYVIDYVANKGGMDKTKDIQYVWNGTNPMLFFNQTKDTMTNTQAVVIFCTDYSMKFGSYDLACGEGALGNLYLYWILYNQTLVHQSLLSSPNSPMTLSNEAISLKLSVDSGIANYKANQMGIKDEIVYNYTKADYPQTANRFFEHFDTSSTQGGFWFFVPIMVTFLTLTSEIVGEKERELRKGLMLFGTSSFSYWVSWIITCLVIALGYGLFIVLAGWCSGFLVFTNTPIVILVFLFMSTIFVYHVLGMIISSSCSDSKSSTKFAYGIMLFSIF